MASYESFRTNLSSTSPLSLAQINTNYSTRRQSSISQPVSSPRVQLIPHSRHNSYDASLSPSDLDLLSKTNFDAKDMSSKDFDFEDVFTYDKPQRKLKSVVEVQCSNPRDSQWSNFGSSHYPTAVNLRSKVNGRTKGAAEMLMKNQSLMRKK